MRVAFTTAPVAAIGRVVLAIVGCLVLAGAADAQTSLPRPDPPFHGTIERTLAGSHADLPPVVRPPEGAPNVLLVLVDDAGFGKPATFGGGVATPTLDALAGRRACATTASTSPRCARRRARRCSPAATTTASATGMIAEAHAASPATPACAQSAAPAREILRENGYITAGIGKWHLTPGRDRAPAGPFDRWPTAWGFDYFWGFLGGERHPVRPDARGESQPGARRSDEKLYYFTDRRPHRPRDRRGCSVRSVRRRTGRCFLYFATGANHAPHHVPKEWATSTRASSTRAGTPTARRPRAPEEAGRRAADTELTERARACRRGTRSRTARSESTRADGGLRRLRGASTTRWGASSTRSRRWPTSTTRWSSTSSATTARAWRGPETGTFNEITVLQRHPADAASSSSSAIDRYRRASRSGAGRAPPPTSRRPGRTPTTRPSSGASRWHLTSAARATPW